MRSIEKEIFKEVYQEIENSKQIFFYVQGYFATEKFSKDENNLQRELRSAIINHYLYIRGDAVFKHHIEMIRELFQPHNQFLKENFFFEIFLKFFLRALY